MAGSGNRLAELEDSHGHTLRLVGYRHATPVCWFALQPERPQIDESWLLQALDRNDLSALQLARGTPASGADCSALVCSCHQVREARILAAIADGCDSVERIGACTRAGTNCGSCIPDLRRLLTTTTVPEALC